MKIFNMKGFSINVLTDLIPGGCIIVNNLGIDPISSSGLHYAFLPLGPDIPESTIPGKPYRIHFSVNCNFKVVIS